MPVAVESDTREALLDAAEELFAADEPEIFAVWAAADGSVFAGESSLGGAAVGLDVPTVDA